MFRIRHFRRNLLKLMSFVLITTMMTYTYLYGNFAAVTTDKIGIEKSTERQFGFVSKSKKANDALSDEDDFTAPYWVNEVPSVDHREKNQLQLIYEAVEEIRSLPRLPFLLRKATRYNKTCSALFPGLSNIEFTNTYWQTLYTSVGILYLYGAYYDQRNITLKEASGPAVRIIGVMDGFLWSTLQAYCQLWFESEEKALFAPLIKQKHMWNRQWEFGRHNSYIFSCRIPSTHRNKIPMSVSVVNSQCDDATINLRVQYEKQRPMKDFAVCVKALDFFHKDISIELVEWIELLVLLGADKIFLYEYQSGVHPNISKVLTYYKTRGIVDLTPITLPGTLPNEPRLRHVFLKDDEKIKEKRQNELVPLNDCMYRNLYSYRYIAVIDIDEVIVPTYNDGSTWKEMMMKIEQDYPDDFRKTSSIGFPNVYFFSDWTVKNRSRFTDIPFFTRSLWHVYRENNLAKEYRLGVKCIHKPERIYAIHNHYPLKCNTLCKYLIVNLDVGRVQHYRIYTEDTGVLLDPNPAVDTTLWKYKAELIKRTGKALKNLGFLSVPPSLLLSSNSG